MKNKNYNKEKNENNNEIKKTFIKKVWYSINKIEKYLELSAEGFGRTIKYLCMLIIIVTSISTLISMCKIGYKINTISQYINEKLPEFTYKDGTLQVDSDEIFTDEDTKYGKIIIDTKTDSDEQINQYVNQVSNDKNAIIILKNKLILKENGLDRTIDYNYQKLFADIGMSEFNKQQLADYLVSSKMTSLYLNTFLVLFIYTFMIYFINTLIYIIMISIVGYIATLILKLGIRYVAVFNMAVYAITLPTILNVIYLVINALFKFEISYFDIMYVLIASVYMISSIFILKTDFDKKQGEVQKIIEIENEEKEKEIEEEQKEKKQSKEDKKQNKKNKEENNADDEEPEGSNA